ncbi:MAG: hypothetical protein IPP98_12040 [Gemmatimonadetes bacterium]|nr:hypothetical protein [Gemmatimonadota bacterium]
MRHLRVIFIAWFITSLGAAAGWFLGGLADRKVAFFAATVVGTLSLLYAMSFLIDRHWFMEERRRGGTIGGLVGLCIAAPLVLMSTATPILGVTALVSVGIGVLVGAGGGALE